MHHRFQANPIRTNSVPELFLTSLILFLVGLVAGTLNVIGGGGSLLSLPVMIFLGLPPTVANGTNRVAILIQNIGAAWSFHQRGLLSREWLLMAVPPALLGALLGTLAAVNIGELAFQRILAVILVVVAAWTLWRPIRLLEEGGAALPTGVKRLTFITAFLILAVTSAAGFNLIRGNALKVTLVLTFTPLTLVLFAWSGKVDWAMGFALAAGNFLGGLAGVHLQILKGHTWVRGVVTATIVVFAVRLLSAS
jgi:uncharacterized membrane protein YfcA